MIKPDQLGSTIASMNGHSVVHAVEHSCGRRFGRPVKDDHAVTELNALDLQPIVWTPEEEATMHQPSLPKMAFGPGVSLTDPCR